MKVKLKLHKKLEKNEFEGDIVVFDVMLKCNLNAIHRFFTRGRHKDSDAFFSTQPNFGSPNRLLRNKCNVIVLFKQTLKVDLI